MTWLPGQRALRVFVLTVLVTIPLCSYYAFIEKTSILTISGKDVLRTSTLRKQQPYSSTRDDSTVPSPTPGKVATNLSTPSGPSETTESIQSAKRTSQLVLGHNVTVTPTPLPSRHSLEKSADKVTSTDGLSSSSARGFLSNNVSSGHSVRPAAVQSSLSVLKQKPADNDRFSISAHSRSPNHRSYRPKAVIILTAKRSGSSFVGELFNHHPDIFYVFEPLHPLDLVAIKNKTFDRQFAYYSRLMLNNTMRCDFHSGYQRELFLKVGSKVCHHNAKLEGQCRRSWSASVLDLEETCKQYKLLVTKTIRVHDIGLLESLLSDTDIDWKIVHLVRDPRPTERSRAKTRPNQNLIRRKGTDRNDEVDLCETLERNLKYWLDTPDWLKGKYWMVRFEDIAAAPYEYARELLEFVDLQMDDAVTRWIKANTGAPPIRLPRSPPGPQFVNRSKMVLSSRHHQIRDQFSTKRDSSKVLEAWRADMDWGYVSKIQKVCFRPMNALGYAIIPDRDTLRDLDTPSTLPLQDPNSADRDG